MKLRVKQMKMLTIAAAAVFAAGLSLGTVAEATEWTLDAAKSTLGFSVNTSQAKLDARFGSYKARISLNRDDLTKAKIVIEIDIASAKIADARQARDLTVAMVSPAWMSAAKYPKAVFTSTVLRSLGGNHYEMDGTLELHGVENELKIPFTLDIDGDTAHAAGEVVVVRTDFDIGRGSFASPANVDLEVRVMFDFTATRSATGGTVRLERPTGVYKTTR